MAASKISRVTLVVIVRIRTPIIAFKEILVRESDLLNDLI